ncbi:unnamed protein product [Adineta ricciae]|uniref:Mevalonate kinase n=2 Tax=Adineta ricciae TaxID=249248 RepID=A0A813V335_ADIRI|nr:unnamed protein product [Adineta ricciae]
MKKTVIVSSPGKLIIGGEHAVVYGRRALVTSIGMRLYMQLTVDENTDKQTEKHLLNFILHDTNQRYSIDLSESSDTQPIEIEAVIYVYNQFKSSLSETGVFNIEVRSEIPIGAGLGSSAAFSVCLVGCFHLLCYGKLCLEDINELAYKVECLFHGTPSGVDNTISTFGQSLLYSRVSKKHLNFRLSNLAIIDTGIPKSTKRMVGLVRSFVENTPEEGEKILNDIETCVDAMVEHPDEINELFQRNQQLLKHLGVSIVEIDQIVEILLKNSISTKITGAGGGGCLIALTSTFTKEQILEFLKDNPVKSIQFVECGVEGLREEQKFL